MEDCSILILQLNFRHPYCDKVDPWAIHPPILGRISAAMVHNEWVNIDEHERSTGPISFPSLAEQGRRSRHYNPKGGVHLSQYSEYSGWSSERDINLTLKCWVFICLWEMWGVHQMTVPILQKPLTVATHPTASAFVAWAHRFLSIQVERPWLNLGSYFMCQFVNKPGSGFSR